jgi:hypothetical protein
MKNALLEILNICFLICVLTMPILYTLKIITCAAGIGRIDWFDAIFLLAYTFILRD